MSLNALTRALSCETNIGLAACGTRAEDVLVVNAEDERDVLIERGGTFEGHPVPPVLCSAILNRLV
jgi:hypothetical protein